MRGYARIWRRLWVDEKFRALETHPSQWLVLYLLSCASNRIGIFTVSTGDIAERLDLRPSEAVVLLEGVCHAMGWEWDRGTRTVWVRSWWRWNPPESPKALMGYVRELRDVPESDIRKSYMRADHGFTDSLREAYRKAIDSLRVHARARAQAEPEPEPEPEKTACLDSAPAPPSPVATQGGQAGAIAPNPWHPPRQLLDSIQTVDPELDVEALVAEVSLALSEGRAKHGNGTLRSWARTATAKGTHRRPKPQPDAFLRQLDSRLDALQHLAPLTRAALRVKAQNARREGASAELVLWGPKYLRAWIAEAEATLRGSDHLASSTKEGSA